MRGAVLVTVLALCAFVESIEYTATVVEYKSIPDDENTVLKNIDVYVNNVDRQDSNVNIIVFPEYGLTTVDVFKKPNWKHDYTLYAPKSYETTNLCDEINHVEKALKDISCVAKAKRIYVVINFIEKDNSTNADLFYNTNLVFDKGGQIVAKYRKINLYEEDELTPGKDIVTFQTDFGVKFGILTCYDILFKNPASDILSDDVFDIIYPTAWISQTPFAISLSVQSGYAKKNKVNLLAANYNNPTKSNGGSGIYHGSGVTPTTYISGQYSSYVLSTKIESITRKRTCEIERGGSNPDATGRGAGTVPSIKDYLTQGTSIEGYTSEYKDLPTDVIQFKDELCEGSLCCKFEASTTEKLSTTGTGAYKWVLTQKDGSISCALVFCKTKEDSSCGERIDEDIKAIFKTISISGQFPKNQYTLPITSKVNLKPIYGYSYCAKDTNSNNDDITMNIYEGYQEDVTAFGIIGYLKGGAGTLLGNAVAIALLGLYAILRNYI